MILRDMKIAIPTKDGKRIATFFRSSPYYKIIKIIDGNIRNISVLKNAPGECPFSDPNDSASTYCTMRNVVDCLNDCQVVIIRRIDHQSWDELGHMGIEVIHTDEKEVDESLEKYLEGNLIDKFNAQ
jgi:predicted Fe-Mo cluster-binding NifX family protein